jgi:hypothetical protein
VQAQKGFDKEEIETGIWKGQFVRALRSPPVSAWAREHALSTGQRVGARASAIS